MTPQVAEVEVATDEEVRAAVLRAVERVGITVEELRNEARTDRFRSERARQTWFAVSPFLAELR